METDPTNLKLHQLEAENRQLRRIIERMANRKSDDKLLQEVQAHQKTREAWQKEHDRVLDLQHQILQGVDFKFGWFRVIDEAMVIHHIGVANLNDTYVEAKQKMNQLLCCAQDIGAYFAKDNS